jgi:hypothetical protein
MTRRFGGTADVRPIGTQDGPVQVGDPHYHRKSKGIIIDLLRQTNATAIRFADNLPGVTAVDPTHRNHIHLTSCRIVPNLGLGFVALARLRFKTFPSATDNKTQRNQ